MKEGMMDLCVIGGFTGLILLLFPSGTSGAAGPCLSAICWNVCAFSRGR